MALALMRSASFSRRNNRRAPTESAKADANAPAKSGVVGKVSL